MHYSWSNPQNLKSRSSVTVGMTYKKLLTLRLLMSYIYIYIYIYEHIFLMFLDHTQRRTTVGRTPLDEWSARRRDLYLTTHDTHNRQTRLCDELITRPEESYRLWCVVVCDLETSRIGAPYIYDISSLRVNDLTLNLLTWRKWTPNNVSKWQMGFNSAFKGLKCSEVHDLEQ